MIESSAAAGCLGETIKGVFDQETDRLKFQRWLAHGAGMSYEEFWSKKNG